MRMACGAKICAGSLGAADSQALACAPPYERNKARDGPEMLALLAAKPAAEHTRNRRGFESVSCEAAPAMRPLGRAGITGLLRPGIVQRAM